MLVAALERDKRGNLRLAGLSELQAFSGGLPDTAVLDYTGSIGRQSFMPALRRLGEDTVPAKMLFKEPCVAEFFAAGRAEFDEVAPALQAQLRKHEEVLAQLRMRKREQFEQLGDVRIGHRCKEIDVAATGCGGVQTCERTFPDHTIT